MSAKKTKFEMQFENKSGNEAEHLAEASAESAARLDKAPGLLAAGSGVSCIA